MKKFFLCVTASVAVLTASAKYGGRIYLDKADGFYKSGETATCKVLLTKDGKPLKGVKARMIKKWEFQVVETKDFETTGKPVALKLIPDRTEIKGDGIDAIPVTVCAVDASGRIVPNANIPVEFEVSALGRNIGVGNGDPTCILSEKADSRPLFNGYAQLIVQSNPGKKGSIEITAKSEGLKSDSCSIKVVAATPLPVIDGFIKLA